MERLIFKKIVLWIVGLLFVLGLIGLVVFGAPVRNRALGHDRFGVAGEIAFNIANNPATALQLVGAKSRMLA